jgi:hypothetical protein
MVTGKVAAAMNLYYKLAKDMHRDVAGASALGWSGSGVEGGVRDRLRFRALDLSPAKGPEKVAFDCAGNDVGHGAALSEVRTSQVRTCENDGRCQ